MKNKKTLILAMLLILVLVSALIIAAFSYARYLSIINADGTAVVARWNFNATNIEGTTLATVALTDTTLNSKVVDGKIAPGTDGSFAIVVDASGSEVALTYDIEIFNFSDSMPENLKFYSSNTFTPENELAIVDGKMVFSDEIALADVNTPVTRIVYWPWAYQTEDGDEQDTLDGIAAGTATFDIKITGIQMDPTTAWLQKYDINYTVENGAGQTAGYASVPRYERAAKTTTKVPTLGENSVFRGWNTEADGSGVEYAAGQTVDQDLTLYAMWEFVVPSGFSIAVGSTADLNAGIVIEDSIGNQFVWVPVKAQNIGYGTGHANENYEQILPDEIESEEMQVNRYGGFYLARYEAGIPEEMETAINTATVEARDVSGVPVSKQNMVPWNYIEFENAKANAESMYSNSVVQSGLLTGNGWDSVFEWLENSGFDTNNNSMAWGNYNSTSWTTTAMDITSPYGDDWTPGTKDSGTSALFKTGTAATISNNLYDIAGNLLEWSGAVYSDRYWLRGGDFTEERRVIAEEWTIYPIANTNRSNMPEKHIQGFRVALYLK